jgi:hypothetical protein
MIGTTSGLGPHSDPAQPGISSLPCGIDSIGLPGACFHAPPPTSPALSTPGREVLRPIVATQPVMFRPRAFPTPRRLAPETGLRAYCSPLPAGVHCVPAGARPPEDRQIRTHIPATRTPLKTHSSGQRSGPCSTRIRDSPGWCRSTRRWVQHPAAIRLPGMARISGGPSRHCPSARTASP